MKPLLFSFLSIATLFAASALFADEAEMLNGKWSAKKVNDEGQNYKQTLEIKNDKFVFQVLDTEDHVTVHAEGEVKFETLGPFKSARFFNIRGGDAPSNLQPVDDEYSIVYTLDGDTWTLASNFDKKRKDKPSAEAYKRVSGSSEGHGGTLVIDAIEMADTPQTAIWYLCFDATVAGVKKRHFLPDKGYEKNKLTIPMALEFSKARVGQKCSFRLQLDDIEEDTCGDEPDQRGTGEFTVTEQGSQTYKPQAGWEFTIRWHVK